MSSIAVVGLGKLGATFASVMAAAGHHVLGIDPYNHKAVEGLNDGFAPVDEPGLARLLLDVPEGRLRASTRYDALADQAASFIIVPTPSNERGRFNDVHVREAARSVAEQTGPGHLIVVCSTVMPGTIEEIASTLPGRDVAYAPQFIALGSVISDLRHPDLAVIGARYRRVSAAVEWFLQPMWGDAHHHPYVAHLSWIDAEIAKLAVNAYVTTKISFANTIAEACEQTPGADASRVLRAIGHDRRIGERYLAPGGPYGGPCFPRDTVAISAWLDECRMPAHLPAATKEVNDRQVRRIAKMFDRYPVVSILGSSYKPGTPVYEESLGVAVARRLDAEGHTVYLHDPHLAWPAWFAATPEDAIEKADAILVATAHPEFGALDVRGKPTVDVWGCLDAQPGVRTVGRWVLGQG
jgi:UDPglucose 6-dehydrogenase